MVLVDWKVEVTTKILVKNVLKVHERFSGNKNNFIYRVANKVQNLFLFMRMHCLQKLRLSTRVDTVLFNCRVVVFF